MLFRQNKKLRRFFMVIATIALSNCAKQETTSESSQSENSQATDPLLLGQGGPLGGLDKKIDGLYMHAVRVGQETIKNAVYCGNAVCQTNKNIPGQPATKNTQFVCQQFAKVVADKINHAKIPDVEASAVAFGMMTSMDPNASYLGGAGHAIVRLAITIKNKTYVFYYEPMDKKGRPLLYAQLELSGKSETAAEMANIGHQIAGTFAATAPNFRAALENLSPEQCSLINKSGGLVLGYIQNYYPDSWISNVCTVNDNLGLEQNQKLAVPTGFQIKCKPTTTTTPPVTPPAAPTTPTPPILDKRWQVTMTSAVQAPCGSAEAPHVSCTLNEDIHNAPFHFDEGNVGKQEQTDLWEYDTLNCKIDNYDPAKNTLSSTDQSGSVSQVSSNGSFTIQISASSPKNISLQVTSTCAAPTAGRITVHVFGVTPTGLISGTNGIVTSITPTGISCGNGQTNCSMPCPASGVQLAASNAQFRSWHYTDTVNKQQVCQGAATCLFQCGTSAMEVDAVFVGSPSQVTPTR